jgi:transposase
MYYYYRELSDTEWARVKLLSPPQKPRTGRPALTHRTMLNAILWGHDTHAPLADADTVRTSNTTRPGGSSAKQRSKRTGHREFRYGQQ